MSKDYSQRRILLRCGDKRYKLFKLSQQNDGSIYISFPRFPKIKWLGVDLTEEGFDVTMVDSPPEEGKLSLHASGIAHVRAHTSAGNQRLRIRGNYLLDRKNQRAGARHLISIFMDEPQDVSSTSDFADRESDFYIYRHGATIQPFAIILFAIPRRSKTQQVALRSSFQMDDLETSPPDSGGGLIDLKYHTIGWIAYRTKFMNHWPLQSHVCYYDGYAVPFYVGSAENEVQRTAELRVEFRMPTYELTDEGISIQI